MKNLFNINSQLVLRVFLILALLIPVTSGFSNTPTVCLVCPGPGVNITTRSASAIIFGWTSVTGAISYNAWYHRHEDNFTSSLFNTSSTNITFSELPPGTYDFYFVTECLGESSGIIIVVDIVMQ